MTNVFSPRRRDRPYASSGKISWQQIALRQKMKSGELNAVSPMADAVPERNRDIVRIVQSANRLMSAEKSGAPGRI
jgi:hypothetical protein